MVRAKNKKGESKKSIQNMTLAGVAIALVTILVLVAYFFNSYPGQQSQPKAAIIDQLSSYALTETSRHVNRNFTNAVRTLLYTRFPRVDYYSDNATVDNYRSLSSMGYKLIVWRGHSALDESGYIAISTSERYSSGYYDEFSSGRLTLCNITGDPRLYVAITPKFVAEVMNGKFQDTVIILMSCNGLKEEYTKTAEAFEERGVRAFVSWDGWVESNDNDQAIALFLGYLINENNTIEQAVRKIPTQSSVFGLSKLDYFPKTPEVGNYTIPDYGQSSTNSAGLTRTYKANSRRSTDVFNITTWNTGVLALFDAFTTSVSSPAFSSCKLGVHTFLGRKLRKKLLTITHNWAFKS
jgi:hypothetical protein